MNYPIVFFRNDDVRDCLDKSLLEITELFLKYKVPISHAVEPANITSPVINWLYDVKKSNPDIIEIIQHGYNHKQKAASISGEFGGIRTYSEQYEDIERGKALMCQYFGKLWTRVFTFPFGTYNYDTLIALQKLGYEKISTGYRHSLKRYIFNALGRRLNRKFILNRPVNYFNEKIPSFEILEVPTSINLTRKVLDKDNSIQKSVRELVQEYELVKKKIKVIGFLLHHRWWKEEDIKTLEALLQYLRGEICQFIRLEEING